MGGGSHEEGLARHQSRTQPEKAADVRQRLRHAEGEGRCRGGYSPGANGDDEDEGRRRNVGQSDNRNPRSGGRAVRQPCAAAGEDGQDRRRLAIRGIRTRGIPALEPFSLTCCVTTTMDTKDTKVFKMKPLCPSCPLW